MNGLGLIHDSTFKFNDKVQVHFFRDNGTIALHSSGNLLSIPFLYFHILTGGSSTNKYCSRSSSSYEYYQVPVRWCKPLLPTLYVAYFVSSWLAGAPIPPETHSVGSGSNASEKNAVQPRALVCSLFAAHLSRLLRLLVKNQTSAPANSWRTIIFSLPSPSRRIRSTHLAINTLLLLAAVEFVLHPFFDPAADVVFTRVGAVYPDGAKIVVRYPELNATETKVKVIWREFKEGASIDMGWRDGPIIELTEQDDWIGTGKLSSLWPSTAYECELLCPNL